MNAYPVTLEVEAPERFERVQLLLRVLVYIAAGALHSSLGVSLYLLLPVVAAVLISQRGGAYFEHDGRWLIPALDWVIGLYAYMLFVTDRFPLESGKRATRLTLHTSGTPNVGSALSRLVTSLPHAFVLSLIGMVGVLVALVATLSILATEQVPQALQDFQRGYVAWIARVFAYHASLVDAYPPFAMHAEGATPQAQQ